jgi:hypothetical protein
MYAAQTLVSQAFQVYRVVLVLAIKPESSAAGPNAGDLQHVVSEPLKVLHHRHVFTAEAGGRWRQHRQVR